ncbi:hypothetical protein Theba_2298 [Mesotoga prima MesG1.Ag.4.2]|uniref:CRISPR type III-B/RAMP module-associated protein Cmr5 n=1 Tax=Mesotoga prima MesG1.Ag.4.2 TaxID=660470 RepID=I2F7M3_9BACT|nr:MULTISPECIES: hypothetical protein [Mesotoga]AFK07926.1 hypothetical protein Theba_2298 [Mesotoga prima MesG1.Ag.4.2]RLL83675.1 hypothetical protein Y696_03970 [Mesotoga sp. H07pep.5.4]
MKNLDYFAAKSGQKILAALESMDKKELEKLINDILLVLHGNGVYACILYLYAREKKKTETAEKLAKEMLGSVRESLGIDFEDLNEKMNNPEDVLRVVNEKICNNTGSLFLVKDLWERTLVYARYGAKAKVKN